MLNHNYTEVQDKFPHLITKKAKRLVKPSQGITDMYEGDAFLKL